MSKSMLDGEKRRLWHRVDNLMHVFVDKDEVRVVDFLPDSVYVWACGEKLDPSDEDVTSSDMLIGWITILEEWIACGLTTSRRMHRCTCILNPSDWGTQSEWHRRITTVTWTMSNVGPGIQDIDFGRPQNRLRQNYGIVGQDDLEELSHPSPSSPLNDHEEVYRVQVTAYVVLITGAERNEKDASYSIYSTFLAMFLMISSSSSDIRASLALLFWGGSWGRCLFGAVLLGCTGLLVTASLRVLFMDAENNAELVIGAATVLFIEDVDAKLATSLTSVPKKWRLFWMLEIIAASVWLAVVGVIQFGNSTAVLDKRFTASDKHLQEVVGYDGLYAIGWGLTMWALFLNRVANHKPGAFRAFRRKKEASVLLLASGSVSSDSASVLSDSALQNERKSRQELFMRGVCLIIVLVFVCFDFFRWSLQLLFAYSAGVFLFFLAGALRAILGSCGERLWRGTPSPPQFTWYRMFVGWGLGTLFYLVYALDEILPAKYPLLVERLLMAVDLLLIVEPTFFGKWVGHWIRSLQEFLMTKNGCIYWTVHFHLVYGVVFWTISAPFFMLDVFE